MTDNRDFWQRTKSVFHQVVELPAGERRTALDRLCGNDPNLRGEVEALLRHSEAAGAFLEQPVRELAAILLDSPDRSGLRIGPYRVLDELAQGGMGRVYRAERADDQFEQQVAIKVLKRGMDTEDIHRRFLTERQILAGLDHPGIARLVDGGITDDGLPYFVMQLVIGEPIDQWVKTRSMEVDETIRLFMDVGEAVEHAHRNLILHRDLKPSNILVDGSGRVRLLDFGISKVLNDGEMGQQEHTALAKRYLTTAYASPEQARGGTLTTASDVYSLGVVLFELLTGRHPFRAAAEPGSPIDEDRRLAPPRASDVAAAERGPRHARALKGDLDVIVRTAMHPDPTRRYGNVSSLVEDLKRHTSGLPIHARGDGLAYRLGKFLGRHRVGVASAATTATLLLASAGVYVAQTLEIREERDKAREVTSFLVDLFKGADPWRTDGDSVTVRALLDRGAERVEQELAGNGEAQATLFDALGQVYHGLGLLEEAELRLDRAVELRRSLAPTSAETAESLNNLGVLLDARGQFDEAEANLREALALRERQHAEPHPSVAESLNDLGQLLVYARGNPDEALALLERALEIRRTLFTPPHLDLAETLHNVGLVYQLRGDFPRSEQYYRESLDMRRALFGDSHPALVNTVNNLALVHHSMGDYGAAEPLYRESLNMRRVNLGDSHPSIAVAMANLALLLQDRGDYQAALPYAREAASRVETAFGLRHPRTATVQNNLADLLRETGQSAEAEALYDQSLATRLDVLGDEHPHVAYSWNGMGRLRRLQGRTQEADSLFARALQLRTAAHGTEHPDVAQTRFERGLLFADMGQLDLARAALSRSLETRISLLGADHPHVADTHLALAAVESGVGRRQAALRHYQSARSIRAEAFPAAHWKNAEVAAVGDDLLAPSPTPDPGR